MYFDVLLSGEFSLSKFSGLSLMFGLLAYLTYLLIENHKVDGTRYGDVKNINLPKSQAIGLMIFVLIFSSLGVFGLWGNI